MPSQMLCTVQYMYEITVICILPHTSLMLQFIFSFLSRCTHLLSVVICCCIDEVRFTVHETIVIQKQYDKT